MTSIKRIGVSNVLFSLITIKKIVGKINVLDQYFDTHAD